MAWSMLELVFTRAFWSYKATKVLIRLTTLYLMIEILPISGRGVIFPVDALTMPKMANARGARLASGNIVPRIENAPNPKDETKRRPAITAMRMLTTKVKATEQRNKTTP